MEANKEYTAQSLLPMLQKQCKEGIVVWEDGNLFYKIVTDLEKEFPTWLMGIDAPKEEKLDQHYYIVVVTGGYNDRYDMVWMLSLPETRKYFL